MPGHTLPLRTPATIDRVYDDLLREHGEAAWGLAVAILRDEAASSRAVERALRAVCAAIDRGSFPTDLSMTSAVLAATRGTALGELHKVGPVAASPSGAPRADAIDRAFSSLPECWRSALWLLEAQRLRPVDAALPLHLAPDDVLDVVASACGAFCSRYVSYATAGCDAACREAAGLLLIRRRGGEVAPHELAAVDQHLAGCESCRTTASVLASPGEALRSAVGRPLPNALAVAAVEVGGAPPRPDRRIGSLQEYTAVVAVVIVIVLAFASATVRIHGSISPDPQESAAEAVSSEGDGDGGTVRAYSVMPAVPADLDATGPESASAPRIASAVGAGVPTPAVQVAVPPAAAPTPAPPADQVTDDGDSREVSISTPETRDDEPAEPSAQVEVRVTEAESEPVVVVELAEVRVEVAVSAEQAVEGDPEGTGPAAPQALGSGA